MKQRKKKQSTTKMLMAFLFINFAIIEIFTGWVTAQELKLAFETGAAIDFTPLVTVSAAVVGEVISYAIYCLKAVKENTKGGIVYDKAMKDIEG